MSGTTEDKVDKDNNPWLYDIVEKNAKDLGLDLEKEGIKVSLFKDSDDRSLKYLIGSASIDFFTKKMYIGTDFLTGLSERVKDPDNFNSALEAVIRHELWHYIDYKNGRYPYKGLLEYEYASSSGEFNRINKINECRADYVNPGNEGYIEYHRNNDLFYTSSRHPSGSDRMRSLMIQSYIKEKTKSESNPDGIILTPNDVEFNEKCECSIINKDKLFAISADVLIEAYNKAERSVPKYIHVSSPQEEPAKVFSGLKPIAQQNWDARKGVGP